MPYRIDFTFAFLRVVSRDGSLFVSRNCRSVSICLSICLFSFGLLYRAHSHLPTVSIAVFCSGVQTCEVRYDTGVGLSADQAFSFPNPACAFHAPLDAETDSGELDIVLSFVGPTVATSRPDRGSPAIASDVSGTTRYVVTASDRAAYILIENLGALRSIRFQRGPQVIAEHSILPGPPGAGALLFDRTRYGSPKVMTSRIESGLRACDVQAVQAVGVNNVDGAVAVLAIVGRGLVVAPLDSSGIATGIDLSPYRVRYHKVRFAVQIALSILAGLLAMRLLRAGLPHGSSMFVIWLSSFTVVLGIWVAAFWPGVILIDSIAPARAAELSEPELWFTPTYSLILIAIRHLGPVYASLSIVQLLISAGLAALVATHIWRAGAPRIAMATGCVFLLASPVIGFHATFAQRAVLACLLNAAAAGMVYRACLGRPRGGMSPLGFGGWVTLVSVLLVSALIRREAILLGFAAVGALWLVRAAPRKWVVLGTVAAVGVFYLAITRMEPWALGRDTQSEGAGYQITALTNTAGAIVSRNGVESLTEAEYAAFEKVVPPKQLAREWHPYDDAPCMYDAINRKPNPEDVRAYRSAVVSAAFRHPATVLQARAETFCGMLLGPPQVNVMFGHREFYSPWCRQNGKDMGVWHGELQEFWPADPPFPGLYVTMMRLLKATLDPASTLSLTWIAWPQFLLLLVAIGAFRSRPSVAAASAILLFRLCGVYAAAPTSAFLYVYDVYLFGFAIPGLWVAEGRLRARLSQTVGVDSEPRVVGTLVGPLHTPVSTENL